MLMLNHFPGWQFLFPLCLKLKNTLYSATLVLTGVVLMNHRASSRESLPGQPLILSVYCPYLLNKSIRLTKYIAGDEILFHLFSNLEL